MLRTKLPDDARWLARINRQGKWELQLSLDLYMDEAQETLDFLLETEPGAIEVIMMRDGTSRLKYLTRHKE